MDYGKGLLMVSLLPGSGGFTGWVDGCGQNKLLFLNGQYVVKSTQCWEGAVENTLATFYPYSNYVLQMEDMASEYERIHMFDKVMATIKIKEANLARH